MKQITGFWNLEIGHSLQFEFAPVHKKATDGFEEGGHGDMARRILFPFLWESKLEKGG